LLSLGTTTTHSPSLVVIIVVPLLDVPVAVLELLLWPLPE